MAEWRPISSYPRAPDASTGSQWGPEAIVMLLPCKHYPLGSTTYVAHLEADMWLSRDADDPECWGELHCEPSQWTPLPMHEPIDG